ncbi:AAA family ATPase [Streptomyces echinoruber]|uniref:Uncharacterized protein n=1 Tax=Streptomyces echinoruber TaxID=68898 RepID=A0A918V627_9ACTN|nr:AAA family ATPase [Streptomyces echinoruber]GGZ69235.1 hypothetical protein GCM10010389_03150 [Streptomyces echinoruber]
MTAPLTPPQPPHRPHAQDAQSARPAGDAQQPQEQHGPQAQGRPVPAAGDGPGWAAHRQDGPGVRTEIREAAVVTAAVTLAGVLLGLLWSWLAPRVPLVGDVSGGGWVVYLKDTEGEQAIGVDGTFTLLAVAFGAVSAAAVFLARRHGGVALVAALGVGGLLGSLLAWRVGVWLGPAHDVIAHAKQVGKGVTFSAPLKLGAKGALLAWSLAALIVHLGLTALFGPRDPDPYPQGPYPQGPGQEPHGESPARG